MRALRFARHTALISIAACLTSAPVALLAQAPAVAGKWIADFELGMRNDNGVITSMGTGKARVTLTAKGDSVFGSWQIIEPAERASMPARALKGVYANGSLTLETEPTESRVRLNDEERTLKMITRYAIKVEGDSMSGTSQPVDLSGSIEPPTRPFKAVREK